MNIQSINSFNQTQTNISMQGHYKKISAFKEIKNIPNVPCACCGRPGIVSENLINAYKVISKPLSRVLSLGLMDAWKNNETIWNFFQKMVKAHPDKSLDKILEQKENYTEFFSAVEKSLDKKSKKAQKTDVGYAMNDIRIQSRKNLRGAGPVMKRLAGFKKFLQGADLEVFEQFQIYAQKYPRKSLSEIVNTEEVYKYHKLKDNLQKEYLREQREFHFNNIKSFIKNVNPEALSGFEELKSEILGTFLKCKDESRRDYLVNQMLDSFLKDNNCERIKTKVFREFAQVPKSLKTVDSFFNYAKYKNFDDLRIISTLLSPVESSFEHIVPNSKSHQDHSSNGLVMHRACNSYRGTIPYSEFIQYHPRMPYNVQKQINFISNLILKGELDENLSQWPIKVAKTLRNYTRGDISPSYQKYCEKAFEKSAEKYEEEEQLLGEMKSNLASIKSKRDKLLREIGLLNDEIKSTNISIQGQNSKKQQAKSSADMFAEELNKLKYNDKKS